MKTTMNNMQKENIIESRVKRITDLERLEKSDSKLEKSAYLRMVCETIIGMDDLESVISESNPKRKLPNNFAQNLIELENIIDIHHSKINEENISNLAELYKVILSHINFL
jgi:hypothetical protein